MKKLIALYFVLFYDEKEVLFNIIKMLIQTKSKFGELVTVNVGRYMTLLLQLLFFHFCRFSTEFYNDNLNFYLLQKPTT